MFVEAVLESSFGFSYVLFVTAIALYHVNNVFRVTVNVMMNRSCFSSRLLCLKVERKTTVEMYLYTELHVGLFQCHQT